MSALLRVSLIRVMALAVVMPFTSARSADSGIFVGAARIDITPELPIRLAGYQGGARQKEASKIERRLFARALAIGAKDQTPVVLITAEVVGVSDEISGAVAAALQASHGLERERIAICTTHVHTGPSIRGVLPYMFAQDIPADETARIARYTETLCDKLVDVARAALADRKPGALAWAEGRAEFATQRRKVIDGKYTGFGVFPDGMADRTLPVLRVTDEQGAIRAVFTSYACHCTTLRGSDNFVHSDWAGEAAAQIESANGGAVALIAIGCGADANPSPRTGLADAIRHGATIAAEVRRVLDGQLQPLGAVTTASQRRIELPLDDEVTREELTPRLKHEAPQIRYSALKFIEQLDAGRPLPTLVPYPVQTWCFGADLAMVFLGGEVVSEYSLRLRREIGASRVWVNAYANSVPCYIASRRMIGEGGYEVDVSMNYYGWPTRLSVHAEDQIIKTVHELLPAGYGR